MNWIAEALNRGKVRATATMQPPAPAPVARVYRAGGVLVEVNGGIYVWPSTCLSEDLAKAIYDLVGRMHAVRPCPCCTGTSFWITPQGRLCSACHPAPPAAVEALRRALA